MAFVAARFPQLENRVHQFLETLSLGVGSGATLAFSEPESTGDKEVMGVSALPLKPPIDSHREAKRSLDWELFADRSTGHGSVTSPSQLTHGFGVSKAVDDHLLLILANDRARRSSKLSSSLTGECSDNARRSNDLNEQIVVNDPIALAVAESN